MKIAVVDDDYTARTLISEFLEDEGHSGVSAAHPDKLQNIPSFGAIVMYVFIGTERHGGIEYILRKREEKEISSDNLVIFVSNFGRDSLEIVRLLDQVGDFEWLDKPIEMLELDRIIRREAHGD